MSFEFKMSIDVSFPSELFSDTKVKLLEKFDGIRVVSRENVGAFIDRNDFA